MPLPTKLWPLRDLRLFQEHPLVLCQTGALPRLPMSLNRMKVRLTSGLHFDLVAACQDVHVMDLQCLRDKVLQGKE